MDATNEFIGAIVTQARGAVDADRRTAGGFATAQAGAAVSALPMTRNDSGATMRFFCLDFDALDDPETELA